MRIQKGTTYIWMQCILLFVLLAGLNSAAWAGREPVCGDNQCNKGETSESCPSDCGSDATGNIFKADLGGMLTSMLRESSGAFVPGPIYSRPDQNLKADPKNVGFSTNGGNEVTMNIDTRYLRAVFSDQEIRDCFPLADSGAPDINESMAYEGTLHLNDYFKQRADLAAYFWFWVGDVQYVFEFRDDGEGWYPNFPPSVDDPPVTRHAWYWLLRVTTRNARNVCVTDGNILAGDAIDPIITFELSSVNACEYPYDDVDC